MHTSTNCYDSDSATEREPPRPKPRQRTLGLSLPTTENIAEDAESQDLSRPQTSSASIPLSTDTSSNIAVRSCGPHVCLVAYLFSVLSCTFVMLLYRSGQKEITQCHVASANPLQVCSHSSSPSPRLILDPEVITGMFNTTTFFILLYFQLINLVDI